jgi:hypothetical protein
LCRRTVPATVPSSFAEERDDAAKPAEQLGKWTYGKKCAHCPLKGRQRK